VLSGSAALTGLGLLPSGIARALPPSSDRKFLFVFARGGWDQTYAFAPTCFGSDLVDMPEGAEPGEIQGIPYVHAPDVPTLPPLLEAHGSRIGLLNGVAIRSVAHDVCLRLAMTGGSVTGLDDWAALIGGHAGDQWLLPVAHLSGPSYTHAHGQSIVRIGANRQLAELMDGTPLSRADQGLGPPSAAVDELEDARVREAAAALSAALPLGGGGTLAAQAARAEERVALLKAVAGDLTLSGGTSLVEQGETLLGLMSGGHAKVGMLAYDAWMDVFNGWDTHAENWLQGLHFEELFAALHGWLDHAATLPGTAGATLADELTIVVLSEMGRYPLLNSDGGKDHWTYTSAMFLGGGVRGGQAVGSYDESCIGQPVDRISGALDPAGVGLEGSHLGATVLALAGLDPEELLPGIGPVEALVL
jgi:hypothetical protein